MQFSYELLYISIEGQTISSSPQRCSVQDQSYLWPLSR
nr:MAG TPA: hypothetical protein [Caudoviricetes sp.]